MVSLLVAPFVKLGCYLLGVAGQRVVLLGGEDCGVIFRAGGVETIPVDVARPDWTEDTTEVNALIAVAMCVSLRDSHDNPTFEQAIQAAGREMGYAPDLVEQVLVELIGPIPEIDPELIAELIAELSGVPA